MIQKSFDDKPEGLSRVAYQKLLRQRVAALVKRLIDER
jgi:hypothetical protein